MSGHVLFFAAGDMFEVTVVNMSSDTGLIQYYGFGSEAWLDESNWNPAPPGDAGTLQPRGIVIAGSSTTIAAIYSEDISPGKMFVVLTGTHLTGSPASMSIETSSAFEKGNFESASSTGGGTYTILRYGGFTNPWGVSSAGQKKTVHLRR